MTQPSDANLSIPDSDHIIGSDPHPDTEPTSSRSGVDRGLDGALTEAFRRDGKKGPGTTNQDDPDGAAD